MSLGLARDSLANLLSLVTHDDNDDDSVRSDPLGQPAETKPDDGGVNDGDDDEEQFFFIDDDEEEGNDVPVSIPIPATGPIEGVPSASPSPGAAPNGSLSTSARTHRTDNTAPVAPPSERKGGEDRAAYQHGYKKLTYAGSYNYSYSSPDGDYGDYYPDPYAVTGYSNLQSHNGANHHSKKNLFCCFTPYAKKDRNDTDQGHDDNTNGSISSDDKFEDVHSAVTSVDTSVLSTNADAANSNGAPHSTTADRAVVTVTTVDTPAAGDAPQTKLPPPNPRIYLTQKTDSFSTAQSIPSTWSSRQHEGEKKDQDDTAAPPPAAPTTTPATTAPTPAPPTTQKADAPAKKTEDKKASTSIVKKRIPVTDAVPLKGILKKTSVVKLTMSINDTRAGTVKENRLSMQLTTGPAPSRRNLFPTYQPRASVSNTTTGSSHGESNSSDEIRIKKNVRFQPMSRVVTVKARTSMSFMEKCQIWWQKPDYDDFKKAARIIAKAMVEGGSEIWLQTSDSWGRQKLKQQHYRRVRSGASSALSPSYQKALRDYGVAIDSADDNSTDTGEEEGRGGDKWWCKFGHSRRGLEHIVSADEGRQRHRYVTDATNAVLAEQRRQRLSHKDPVKLASVSLRLTSWARELAFAAGAADDEAVRSRFCTSAKSRISHLHENLKVMDKKRADGAGSGRRNAQFILSANPVLTSVILDENTRSSQKLRNSYRSQAAGSSSTKLNGGNAVFNSQQMRKLDEYHNANEGENKEPDIAKVASGFGAPSGNNMLLRYKV